jgi:sigma-B regulation protein RsbU (phosphoserine phosphatase)
MIDHRELHKTIESFDVGTFDSSDHFLTHVLEQIVKHDNIAIKGGRLWKLDSAHRAYCLIAQVGTVQKIREGFVLKVLEYPPFKRLALERTIVSNETKRYFRKKGIVKYSATGVGEIIPVGRDRLYEFILTFNTDLDRKHVAPTFDIISMTATRMLRSHRSERKTAQFEKELDKAREIQQSILPEKSLRFHHYEIFGTLVADKIVGGDFFDYIVSPENDRVDIAIGDAASKGISAAVQALYVSGALRMGTAYQTKISTLVRNINTLVHHAFKDERFLTLFVAELTDDSQGLCVYVNAGHNSPLLSRAKTGAVEQLGATGTIIGPFPDQLFRRESIMLNKGDVLLLYTDGVSEAMDASRKQYSEKRLARKLRELRKRSAREIARLILADVQKFNAKSKYVDDKTVVVIKRVG